MQPAGRRDPPGPVPSLAPGRNWPDLAWLVCLALALAWMLTKTSTSLAGNLPIALLAMVAVRRVMVTLDWQRRSRDWIEARAQPLRARRHDAPPSSPAPTFGMPPSAAKPDSWRKFVRAPVVEEAWARFAGSILQEFVYDTWYTLLTADREFPAEVRRLLNTAFGHLALRARQLDLRAVMHDVCELVMEQLELYRDTRESILLATQQPHCLRDMSAAAAERAFQREMRAEKNLHPALQTPDGHYRFLKAVSEGVVAYLLDVPDLQRPIARVVCRELLSSCVFRPLMMWSTPYYYQKALYAVLKEQAVQKRIGEREAGEVSAALATARSDAMRGHWEFEQRLLSSVAAEDTALTAARQLRHTLRSKLSQHNRSKSVDNVSLSPSHSGVSEEQPLAGRQPAQSAQQQQQQQQQQQLHHRARSCSPAVLGNMLDRSTSAAAVMVAGAGDRGGISTGQRGRPVLPSNLRPPRPPSAQHQTAEQQAQQATQQQPAEEQAQQTAQPPQQAQQEQAERSSSFDVYNVASAVASVLLPGAAAAQHRRSLQQQQRRSGSGGQEAPRAGADAGWRRAAEGHEAASLSDGEGWESVDVSDVSLTLGPRDFSLAHLLAPLADQSAVAGFTPPRPTSGRGARARAGFAGLARGKVVAADLNTSGSKDYVEFKVRVADDAGEWTISRRYRNFESLHRQLRQYPSYRLKLPPKRIFIHSNNVEFVEERREALDRYLQALLAHQQLSQCSDVYEFLQAASERYELASPQQQQPLPSSNRGSSSGSGANNAQRGVLGGLSKAVIQTSNSMGRGLSSASGAVAGTVKQGVSELASAASEGVGLVADGVVGAAGAVRGVLKTRDEDRADEDPRQGLTRRVQSVPSMQGLERASSGSSGADAEPAKRGNSGSALPRPAQRDKSSSLLSKASTRLRQAMQREPSGQQQQLRGGEQPEVSGVSSSSSNATAGSEHAADMSASPSKRSSRLFSSLRRQSSKSRSVSPQKQGRERSPARKPRRSAPDGIGAARSRRNSEELEGAGLGSAEELPPHVLSSLRVASPSPAPPSPIFSFPLAPSLDLEDCAGISAPIYEVVDCLFQLQTRGFFRRQVFAVARQTLSLVAGEAIDAYLTQKLRLLRQQHTIGRIIHRVQTSLWPGGVWFQHTAVAQAQAAAAVAQAAAAAVAVQAADAAASATAAEAAEAAAAAASGGGGGGGSNEAGGGSGAGNGQGRAPGYQRPAGMDPEKFLNPTGPAPLDEDEIREAVEQLMLRRAPAALVRLIGKTAYASGVQDLLGMLQSPTFCFHLGYGCLEVALVHLFPELKSLFRTLQHGGLG